MCECSEWCVCVCVLIGPAPLGLSNGKICSCVPDGLTVAYLCGFIAELPGALGAPPCLHPIS